MAQLKTQLEFSKDEILELFFQIVEELDEEECNAVMDAVGQEPASEQRDFIELLDPDIITDEEKFILLKRLFGGKMQMSDRARIMSNVCDVLMYQC